MSERKRVMGAALAALLAYSLGACGDDPSSSVAGSPGNVKLHVDAPESGAHVAGTIVTFSGSASPGATVRVADERAVTADAAGRWQTDVALDSGEQTYRVTASVPGFGDSLNSVSLTRAPTAAERRAASRRKAKAERAAAQRRAANRRKARRDRAAAQARQAESSTSGALACRKSTAQEKAALYRHFHNGDDEVDPRVDAQSVVSGGRIFMAANVVDADWEDSRTVAVSYKQESDGYPSDLKTHNEAAAELLDAPAGSTSSAADAVAVACLDAKR